MINRPQALASFCHAASEVTHKQMYKTHTHTCACTRGHVHTVHNMDVASVTSPIGLHTTVLRVSILRLWSFTTSSGNHPYLAHWGRDLNGPPRSSLWLKLKLHMKSLITFFMKYNGQCPCLLNNNTRKFTVNWLPLRVIIQWPAASKPTWLTLPVHLTTTSPPTHGFLSRYIIMMN